MTKIFLHQGGQTWTYADLARDMDLIPLIQGKAIVLEAENNYQTFVRFLSLIKRNHIVHMVPSFQFNDLQYRELINTETKTDFLFWGKDDEKPSAGSGETLHEDLKYAEARFIVRTSGSSGKKFKFVLHDPGNFIKKYQDRGSHFEKTFAFSPAETIAGIETLLETYVHQKILVGGSGRPSPGEVSKLLGDHQVDFFQTTPSFMNLMSASGQMPPATLKKIAYGSEPSQKTVLENFKKTLPELVFMHTYGMSEIGIQKTETDQENPTRFHLDQKFNPGRIVEGVLEVKSKTPMLCYLNHPDKVSPDGWFRTGDMVTEEEGYLKVTGRDSDLINLAGRKFFPSDVEELIMQMDSVKDVTIKREANDLIGSILIAEIVIDPEQDEKSFRMSFKQFCQNRLPYYMHPHKVTLLKSSEMTQRFKKMRN